MRRTSVPTAEYAHAWRGRQWQQTSQHSPPKAAHTARSAHSVQPKRQHSVPGDKERPPATGLASSRTGPPEGKPLAATMPEITADAPGVSDVFGACVCLGGTVEPSAGDIPLLAGAAAAAPEDSIVEVAGAGMGREVSGDLIVVMDGR